VALRPTVGQTLLEGISQSQPQPKIPAEMIKYMGRHVHAWHIAISMLEGHVVLFPTDMRCFDALCNLYRALAEDDMAFGLWHRRAISEDTRVALALRQHGFLTQAQLQFLELMGRGVSGGIQGEQQEGQRARGCCAVW
jgi:transformation/transcription domain-associated protein